MAGKQAVLASADSVALERIRTLAAVAPASGTTPAFAQTLADYNRVVFGSVKNRVEMTQPLRDALTMMASASLAARRKCLRMETPLDHTGQGALPVELGDGDQVLPQGLDGYVAAPLLELRRQALRQHAILATLKQVTARYA